MKTIHPINDVKLTSITKKILIKNRDGILEEKTYKRWSMFGSTRRISRGNRKRYGSRLACKRSSINELTFIWQGVCKICLDISDKTTVSGTSTYLQHQMNYVIFVTQTQTCMCACAHTHTIDK